MPLTAQDNTYLSTIQDLYNQIQQASLDYIGNGGMTCKDFAIDQLDEVQEAEQDIKCFTDPASMNQMMNQMMQAMCGMGGD